MMNIVSTRVCVVNVRKPRLSTLTIVLENSKEACYAVPRSTMTAHPSARRLRGVIPVMMLVEELPGSIAHELRGADYPRSQLSPL